MIAKIEEIEVRKAFSLIDVIEDAGRCFRAFRQHGIGEVAGDIAIIDSAQKEKQAIKREDTIAEITIAVLVVGQVSMAGSAFLAYLAVEVLAVHFKATLKGQDVLLIVIGSQKGIADSKATSDPDSREEVVSKASEGRQGRSEVAYFLVGLVR